MFSHLQMKQLVTFFGCWRLRMNPKELMFYSSYKISLGKMTLNSEGQKLIIASRCYCLHSFESFVFLSVHLETQLNSLSLSGKLLVLHAWLHWSCPLMALLQCTLDICIWNHNPQGMLVSLHMEGPHQRMKWLPENASRSSLL